MASAISTPTLCSSLSSTKKSRTVRGLSSSVVYLPSRKLNDKFFKWVPQLGLCKLTQWNGLKNMGVSTVPIKLERKGGCRGKGAYASLFGVGAPEVLVIGVVALLVFGPKGLAEVARNLGKTLRAFQPTIKELQEVSREFKSTLEREIGIDDIQISNWNSTTSTKTPSSPPLDADAKASPLETDLNGSPSPNKAVSSEELLAITEEQLKAAALKQQQESASPADKPSGSGSPVAEQQIDKPSGEKQPQDSPQQEAASASPNPGKTETD